jgi:hypothetical protein
VIYQNNEKKWEQNQINFCYEFNIIHGNKNCYHLLSSLMMCFKVHIPTIFNGLDDGLIFSCQNQSKGLQTVLLYWSTYCLKPSLILVLELPISSWSPSKTKKRHTCLTRTCTQYSFIMKLNYFIVHWYQKT